MIPPVHSSILASETVISGDKVASVELDPGLVGEALQPPTCHRQLNNFAP